MTVRAQRTEPMTIALAIGSILATMLVAAVFIAIAMRGHSCTREPQKYTYNGQTHVAYQVVCT